MEVNHCNSNNCEPSFKKPKTNHQHHNQLFIKTCKKFDAILYTINNKKYMNIISFDDKCSTDKTIIEIESDLSISAMPKLYNFIVEAIYPIGTIVSYKGVSSYIIKPPCNTCISKSDDDECEEELDDNQYDTHYNNNYDDYDDYDGDGYDSYS